MKTEPSAHVAANVELIVKKRKIVTQTQCLT